MSLPEKTFLTQSCLLAESDFESNGQVKPFKVMQLLQDVATDHAEKIGVGWDVMNKDGRFWVISKMKVVFNKCVTRELGSFTLYTWPIAPNRYFAERCFSAQADGQELFAATSMWMLVNRSDRKILSATLMNDYFHGEYSAQKSIPADFRRIKPEQDFAVGYEREIRRSDLDHNAHVNNTNYITFALDVLSPAEVVTGFEIVYHKELKLGDKLQVLFKRSEHFVEVVGMRQDEVCFTALLNI